jgi:hypothetical protein
VCSVRSVVDCLVVVVAAAADDDVGVVIVAAFVVDDVVKANIKSFQYYSDCSDPYIYWLV